MTPARACRLALGASFVALQLARAQAPVPKADFVVRNGKIVTMETDQPQVRALAARDGAIVALGSDADIQAHVGEGTQVIDLGGRLAIPGVIEGHGHFTGIGQALLSLDLRNVKNW